MNAHIMHNRLSTVNLVWTKNSQLFQYHLSSMFLWGTHNLLAMLMLSIVPRQWQPLSLHLTVSSMNHSFKMFGIETIDFGCFSQIQAMGMCISGPSSSLNSSCQPQKNKWVLISGEKWEYCIWRLPEIEFMCFLLFFTSEISDQQDPTLLFTW